MMCAAPTLNLVTHGMDAKFAAAGRMATAIIQVIQQKGECLPQDLYGKGFSAQEVREHWHMANSLAEVELRITAQRGGKHHA